MAKIAKPKAATPEGTASRLTARDRVILFCAATGTDYAAIGITARAISSSQHGLRRSGPSERRDILARRPWLREMGQWLRAEYNAAVDQPVPERLAALLKELRGRRH